MTLTNDLIFHSSKSRHDVYGCSTQGQGSQGCSQIPGRVWDLILNSGSSFTFSFLLPSFSLFAAQSTLTDVVTTEVVSQFAPDVK